MPSIAALCLCWLVLDTAAAVDRAFPAADPVAVIEGYLRAVYARDFAAAYQFISAEDRKVRDLNRYLRQRGTFSGFILEVSRKLGDALEVKPVSRQENSSRTRVVVRYRVPDPKKLAPRLFDWNAHRLNSLPLEQRRELLAELEGQKRDGLLGMMEGTESFDLVREGDQWRIFLNWAAGVRIPLRLDRSKLGELDVSLSRSEFVLQPGELFMIELSIRNRASAPATVRIGHLVEPREVADYLDFVECGFWLPVTIEPGQQRIFSGTYMLRDSLPEGVRQVNLTYDFRSLK